MAEQRNYPIHVNVFLKGMMQDIDINDIPADRYFLGEDIKLLDKEGQGYVLTNVDGNEYAFALADGFIPIGQFEHKDIMYIVSTNSNGLGEGEIGSFPSPDPNNPGKWLLQYRALRNYNDARTGKVKTNLFRTDLFEMDPRYRVDMIAKDHYDGSVNLYFADGNNQLRSVNTGFNQEAVETFDENDPPYTDVNFVTKVNLILGSTTSSEIVTNSVTLGGNLKFGNYIFFVKYVTESFDETYFVAESNPIPIFRGSGDVGSVYGDSAGNRSDKKIQIRVNDVDTTYKYAKVGYIRHYSDFNGVPTYEFGEINNRYEIDPNQSYLDIDIIGTEGELFLTEEEIMLKKDTEIIPGSITQLANRMWGANWKKVQTHNQALVDFAKLIKISYDTVAFSDQHIKTQGWLPSSYQYADYNNYDYIGYFRGEAYPFGIVAELNDGSFSDIYPCNGVDMWDDITPDYDPDGTDKGNYNGIYRFPNAITVPALGNTNPNYNHVKPMGVKFDTEEAWVSIMAANPNNWIRFNVRAIYFVRGDRFETLKYQGLMIGAAAPFLLDSEPTNAEDITFASDLDDVSLAGSSQLNPSNYPQYRYFQEFRSALYLDDQTYQATSDYFWGHRSTSGYSSNWFAGWDSPNKWGPVYRGYAPAYVKSDDHQSDRSFVTRYFIKPDKYCFYSPDMLFNAFNDVDSIQYVWRVGKTISKRPQSGINNGIWKHDNDARDTKGYQTAPKSHLIGTEGIWWDQTERLGAIDNKIMVGEGSIIKPGDTGYFDFINGADEPITNSLNIWHWMGDSGPEIPTNRHHYNRSMVFAKYLGIDLDGVDVVGGTLQTEDFNLDIVNLYTVDPSTIDITNLFPNINAIKYKKISGPVLVSDVVAGIIANDWDDLKSTTAWKGDCFLQRTYFKQMYWAGDSLHYYLDDDNWDSPDLYDEETPSDYSVRISHGLIMGFVTENKHNTAMRSEDDTNSFWPATQFFPWAVKPYNESNVESFNLNFGYDKSTSSNVFLPYDPALPDKELQYTARVRYTDKTIPGSYIDSYRTFRPNNYRDFDTNFGEIHRLCTVFDRLVSIQEDAIIEHYTNEREVQGGGEGQSAILGYGDVLSPNYRKMSNFGTQHKWSVIEADTLYGSDWKRQILWEVGLKRSDSGTLFLDARDITKEASIQKWMRDTALVISNNRSDKFNEYGDDTMNGEGIVSGYDKSTGDVYFIFHNKTENV